jgi:4-alpha-glucanotransferase
VIPARPGSPRSSGGRHEGARGRRLGVAERPNRPGTTTEWPNWSLALPQTLEDLERDPGPARLAEVLRRSA